MIHQCAVQCSAIIRNFDSANFRERAISPAWYGGFHTQAQAQRVKNSFPDMIRTRN